MVSCSVLTVNIGVVLAKTEESFGNLRLKIYLCHIIHLFSYQYAMKKYLLLIFVILIHSFAVLADNVKDTYLFRKVDYQLGLSNSAVLSLFQDNEGLMWYWYLRWCKLLRREKYGSLSFGLFGTKDFEQ